MNETGDSSEYVDHPEHDFDRPLASQVIYLVEYKPKIPRMKSFAGMKFINFKGNTGQSEGKTVQKFKHWVRAQIISREVPSSLSHRAVNDDEFQKTQK